MDFETLVDFLEQPDAVAHAPTRRRLLASAASRERADLVARLRRTLREEPQRVLGEGAAEPVLTADLRMQLAALRAGRLDATAADGLRARLAADPRLLREALHDCVAATATRAAATRTHPRLVCALRDLFDWQVPAWAAAGTAAVLVLAVTLLVPSGGDQEAGLRLAAYRDDATLRFAGKDTLPGMGFFADAQSETQPFSEVELQLRDDGLHMSWPDVAGARGYTVQLLVVDSGAQREVASRDVAASEALLEIPQPQPGRRYEWVISGVTDDQRRFATRGGFVLR